MHKKILLMIALLCAMVQGAWAQDVELSGSDSYTAHDGDVLTGSTSGTVTIAAGAKVTLNGITITGGIVCAGDAEITLIGINSVTGRVEKAGIQVGGKGTTLIINGDGSLTATGGEGGAGIGTGYAFEGSAEFGNITINGGMVTATGGNGGAGIGTGYTVYYSTVSFGNIVINGGTVTATGGENGAGIGTGYTRQNGNVSIGDITINGGTVTATGGDGGAGIGTGFIDDGNVSLGNIVIEGGTITATGGEYAAGIGTGETFNGSSGSLGNIIINGGTVTATGGYDGAGIGTGFIDDGNVSLGNIVIEGGTITATGGENGAGIGTGYKLGANVTIGSINIYCDYDFHMLDASSFSKDITYMYGDTDVTSNATEYFSITTNGDRNIIKSLATAKDGDELTGTISATVTIVDGAKVTLNGVNITGGIVCEGTAEITLVGTNSVTGASQKAGIQVGGEGTTLTIKGDGSLTATGTEGAAGIGLSLAMNTGGHIVIEGGTITALGGQFGAGIGTCFAYNVTVALGNITFKGGTVTATGGENGGAGIGTGVSFFGGSGTIGTVTVYTGVDRIEASGISKDITYMSGNIDVTANASDFFGITVDGSHYVIVTDNPVTLADGTPYNWIYDPHVTSATYVKTLGEERVGKHQAWFVPFDYTITSDDEEAFTFYKINMIANAPNPQTNATDDIWVFLKKLEAGDVLHGNMPYVYKPKQAVTDYAFTTLNTTLLDKNEGVIAKSETLEDVYSFYATYANTTATTTDPFYYVNIDGELSYGDDVTVGPYRWIIRKTSKFGTTPTYARRMYFIDGESTTGVTTTNFTNDTNGQSSMDNGQWYTLDGRKLVKKPMKKGLYINNGRKVVVK